MVSSRSKRQGFALIVVLSTLSIVALLFAIASSRFISSLMYGEAEIVLGKREQENRAFAELALGAFGQGTSRIDPSDPMILQNEKNEIKLVLQDVGGLIDLNAAAPDLLDTLTDSLDMPIDAIEIFRDWRRTPYRLQSVADFSRVANVPYEDGLRLRKFATVHSGRSGISPDAAPSELLTLLEGVSEASLPSGAHIPPAWRTPASGVNYQVELWIDGSFSRLIGVIHVEGLTGQARILELY